MVDPQGRIVMIDSTAQRLLGCSDTEALDTDFAAFTALRAERAGTPLAINPWEVAVSDRLAPPRFTPLRLSGRVTPPPPARTASRLDALQQRLCEIFERVPAGICLIDGERIVFANQAALSLFRAPQREAVLGRSLYTLLHARSRETVRRQIEQVRPGGVLVNAQGAATAGAVLREHLASLDGSVREVEITVSAWPHPCDAALQLVITDVTQLQRERAEHERSRLELRRLSASLVEAREEERHRIARELHDELGQQLSALKMEIGSLNAAAPGNPQASRVTAMLGMVDDTVASVRRIAADLRPLMLDDLGLNAAVEWLARESARRMGIEIELKLGAHRTPIAERASIAIYRMVQESLTNIGRHAGASQVLIEIQHARGELRLTVEDNGVGIGPQSMHREGSHGLMGMRERSHMLGGRLEIGRSASGGGRIAVRLPMAGDAQGSANANSDVDRTRHGSTRIDPSPTPPGSGSGSGSLPPEEPAA